MRLHPHRILPGAKPEFAREAEGAGHADRHALAMDETGWVVMGEILERMPERMAQIEQGSFALLRLIGGDDARLGGAACRDGLYPRRPPGEGVPPTPLQELEKAPIADQSIFDDLGVARAELALAERIEALRVRKHERGLMKGANKIFAARRIDPGFAADARVDLSQQRGRNLNEAYASAKSRGAKSCQVADHPAPERNDNVPALDARLDQRVGDPGEFGVRLGRFARRANDRGRTKAGVAQACGQPIEIERRDI